MTGLTVALEGADQLASSVRDAADALAAGLDPDPAAQEVIGYIKHPAGTPAGVARGLHVESTDDGFALVATGTNEAFLTRFLTDPFDARAQDVANQYAQQIQQLLDTVQGA